MAENSVLGEPTSGKTTYRHENGTQITTQLHLHDSEVMDMTPLINLQWRCLKMAAMSRAAVSSALAGPEYFEPAGDIEAPENF
ncbi:hypothetical protein BM221_010455 [Beauveria bassiana]|uniref:Uncharacterized protein n=1 Tax=Beauveria bassiana TaxID=176275 RepID=A0A2N6N8V9_BEABA|nr:hypothetical protein BM221_010455 [Beauveria bassiana]